MATILIIISILSFIAVLVGIILIIVKLTAKKGDPIKKLSIFLATSLIILTFASTTYYEDIQKKKQNEAIFKRYEQAKKEIANGQKPWETVQKPVVNLKDKVEEILITQKSYSETSGKKFEIKEEDVIAEYHDTLNLIIKGFTKNHVSVDKDLAEKFAKNASFYPAQDLESIEAVKKESISNVNYEELMKNPDPYRGKILEYKAVAIDFLKKKNEGIPLNFILVVDKEYDYVFIIFKDIGDIKKGDEIRFWGSPIGIDSFKNIGGDKRKAVVFFGSHVEKNR